MKRNKIISPQVINRLPKYFRCLMDLEQQGVERTSSAEIARLLGTTPSQVRQDFSLFGSYGATGYGYATDTLVREIGNILGVYDTHRIAVIGVGCIGRALLEHMEFERYHYQVCSAFDVDPTVIGTTINGIQVYDFAEFPKFMEQELIDICMLTVSKEAAKTVAKELYDLGISAIWNFTNADLDLDESDIMIQNVNFLDSLLILTYYLEEYRNMLPIMKRNAG